MVPALSLHKTGLALATLILTIMIIITFALLPSLWGQKPTNIRNPLKQP